MSVSKRLRYEILRRDNHTCRYCGAAAPDVPLRVDHVVPVALGGNDAPSNLVAACQDCNSGKSSATADHAVVAEVGDDALRWAAAMQQAAENLREMEEPKLDYRKAFLKEWNRWGIDEGGDRKALALPGDWKASIERFRVAGLPTWVWAEIVDTAMGYEKVLNPNKFKYCCGIAWNKVTALQEEARRVARPKSAAVDATEVRKHVSSHLYCTWVWAWERTAPEAPREVDVRDFMEDVAELLQRGLSAKLDLTEVAFQAGSDLATDPSSYLPAEHQTPEERADRLPLSHEEAEIGGSAYASWWSAWEKRDPAGPTARQDRIFGRQLRQAITAGYEPDQIAGAAWAAALDGSPELIAYLPEERPKGGGN